jgi:hypothetical protein
VVALLAVVIGAGIGTPLGALGLAMTNPAASDLVGEKYASLQYHIAEILPQPQEPRFVPTPFFLPTLPAATGTAEPSPTVIASTPAATPTPSPKRPAATAPSAAVAAVQPAVLLRGLKHDYQRWNNCGPTTLEMDLSYFGRTDTQAEIAAFTKPNSDDRNVRPDELAAYVSKTGLRSIVRVGGTLDRLKLLLSNGIPVIVETSLVKQPQGWMGHYRLVVGYDSTQFVTMDSYDGPSLKIAFVDLDSDWRAFDRLYLVVYSDSQAARVRAIVGDKLDDQTMYAHAAETARAELAADAKDGFAEFNLGTNLVGLGQFEDAAGAFDRARELDLPWRMLWYQFGPYEAYLKTGRNDEVIALADSLLKATDDLEESHYYKGLALRALGREEQAKQEFEAALRYNSNYVDAQRALEP